MMTVDRLLLELVELETRYVELRSFITYSPNPVKAWFAKVHAYLASPHTNSIRQHVPGFFDAEPQRTEFSTVEELRGIEWVYNYLDEPGKYLAQRDGLLMVVSGDGKWWWVIGYLQQPVNGLPRWAGPVGN